MDLSNLRSGNFVRACGVIVKVETVSPSLLLSSNNVVYSHSCIEPIPIHPIILASLGCTFRAIIDENSQYTYPILFGIDWSGDNSIEHKFFYKCRYIHEFQNSYFRAARQELEIDSLLNLI